MNLFILILSALGIHAIGYALGLSMSVPGTIGFIFGGCAYALTGRMD